MGRTTGTAVRGAPGGDGSILPGIGLAALAYFVFSIGDATTKWLAADYPPAQILFMRSVIIAPACLILGGPSVAIRAATSPIRVQLLLRSLVLVAAWVCYYTAARYLQLAELVTIYFSSPLLVAVLATPLLKERVTRARWASIAIGFAGVIIACRPSDLHQLAPIGLALLAAVLWACTTILIRQVVHAEATFVLMLFSNGVILAACGAAMPFLWRTPGLADLGLIILLAAFSAAGQFLATEGIRRAPATVVAPISFSSLLWAFCFGFIVWGDVPGLPVFTGAALILLSGLMVAAAEWRALRRSRATAPLRSSA